MSRITIAQLEALRWVAELGAVHKAADRLGVTQPTVSFRLRQLEAELGQPVPEPHGRGVRLTRAGEAFVARTRPVLDAYAQLRSASAQVPVAGVLRIGLAEGFAVACLPHLVPAFRRSYPLLRPEWTVTTSWALERGVVAGELDLAVLVDPVGDRTLTLVPLGRQPNVWAGSPKVAARAAGGLAAMLACTVITTPPPTAMYRHTIGWFGGQEQAPGSLCLCTSVNAAAQLAGAGIGIGVFPRRMIAAQRGTDGITAIKATPSLPDGHVHVACRADTDPDRTRAATSVIRRVTRALRYFDI